MIQQESTLNVADNSGAKKIQCIRVLGGSRKKYARPGDMIVAAVKTNIPHSNITKGEVVYAVVVRSKKERKRKNGIHIRFDDNAAVIVTKEGEPRGTRILGPIARELRAKGYFKIISLAPEVV